MAIGFPTKANWAAGDVLTASAQDDLAGTVNLLSNASAASGTVLLSNVAGTSFSYSPLNAAGKNALINGGMDIWQRSTSAAGSGYKTADRWYNDVTGTVTSSQETTVIPSAASYALKWTSGAASSYDNVYQCIETANTLPLRGQIMTLSAYVQVSSSYSGVPSLVVAYNTVNDAMSGTWTNINTAAWASAPTTGYVRQTLTVTIPSSAVGIRVGIINSAAQASGQYMYIGNVQLELGSVATAFSRAGGTLQGELAACQRYYWRGVPTSTYSVLSSGGFGTTSTTANIGFALPVPLRVEPSSIDFSTIGLWDSTGPQLAITAVAKNNCGNNTVNVVATVASGVTANRPYQILSNGSTSGYIGFSAEL